MMNIDLPFLIDRMAKREDSAFIEFEELMREVLPRWLRAFGLTESKIANELPGYVFELGILVVVRRHEIDPQHPLVWLRIQARNLALLQWRKEEVSQAPAIALTAQRVHASARFMDGSRNNYLNAARVLGVPASWLQHRHQHLSQPGMLKTAASRLSKANA